MNQILENGSFGLNSCSQFFFFFQNLASSVTRYHGHLSPCTISEKKQWSNIEKI